MNREEARKLLPIIQAFAEGKKIEVKQYTPGSPIEIWREEKNFILFDDDYFGTPEVDSFRIKD